jgi:hypothetical protein
VDPGLYLTFFNEGEHFDAELPPVGPLEHVVVRDGSLVADRKDGRIADSFDGGKRWIEAEYEFQRAIGNEPGGARRRNLRIVAPQGVYLRFVSFGSFAEHDAVPELGPYAVVVVDPYTVEADGDRLASRSAANGQSWELTGTGGTALVGVVRPDIAFRTRSTLYHPQLKPFRPVRTDSVPIAAAKVERVVAYAPAPLRIEPTVEPPPPPLPKSQHPVASPTKTLAASQVPEAATVTLRDRIRAEQPKRPGPVASYRTTGRQWAGALWKLRFAVIAALVILVAVFSVPSIGSLFSGGVAAGPISTVSVSTSLASANWNYAVGSVRRVAKIGGAQARGTFLVVQIAATNRKGAGAQLLPNAFALATAGGQVYQASSVSSNVYSGDLNPNSSYTWPTEFPVGRSVVVPLIFEVPASVSGTQLVIFEVPSTRIRLE